jgi:hypothetical protein
LLVIEGAVQATAAVGELPERKRAQDDGHLPKAGSQ